MATTTDNPPREWTQLVQTTEKRNGVMELRADPAHHDLPPEQRVSHRVRLIQVRPDGWIVERPFSLKGEGTISPGMRLCGMLGVGAARWGFETEALEAIRHQLNAQASVPALRLAPPMNVRSAQRRAFFRVPMLAAEPARATVWPLLDIRSAVQAERANLFEHKAEGSGQAMPVRSPDLGSPMDGRILDLSAGGLAVLVGTERQQEIEPHECFWIEMNLPGLGLPLRAVGRKVRCASETPESLTLAMAFTFTHHRAHETFVTDTLCRVAAGEQRRQLQRQR